MVVHVVEEMYPTTKKLTLVQDNLSARKKSAFYEIFEPERARAILEKVEFVYTLKHGSWLNIAIGPCFDGAFSPETSITIQISHSSQIKSRIRGNIF
jgi:hypothetical protein